MMDFAVDLQQQVRAALQIETQHHALMRQEARPAGGCSLGKKFGMAKKMPSTRDDEDDRGAERRELQHAETVPNEGGPAAPAQ